MSLPPEIQKYQEEYCLRVIESQANAEPQSEEERERVRARAKEISRRWKEEHGDPRELVPEQFRRKMNTNVDWEAEMEKAGYTVEKFGSKARKKSE